LLVRWLGEQDVAVASFRDPGATVIGEKIREILLSPAHQAMTTATEVLLYMAARAQLWAEEIAPALRQGKCVVVDRWLSSTCAYQGFAGGFGIDKVIALAGNSLERVWPDLTIILDMPPEESFKRVRRQKDRIEQRSLEYHQQVRRNYLAQATADPQHYRVINADADRQAVQEQLWQLLGELK
jgi:dTMP kinase